MAKTKKEKAPSVFVIDSLKANIVFIVLSFIVYAQCLKFDFTHHDDLGLVRSKELVLSNAVQIFEKGVFFFTGDIAPEKDLYYRPVQNIVYATVNSWAGNSAGAHHFANILLHIIACGLLFRFLVNLGFKNNTAFLTTVLFTVHPLLVQGVAWIPGSGELLITIFLLAGFNCIHRLLSTEKMNVGLLLASLLFFLLALLSKESAIGFVPLIVFYFLFLHPAKERNKKPLLFFAIGLVPVIVTWYLLRQHAVGAYAHLSLSLLFQSLVKNGSLVIYYIGKAVLPFHLGPMQSADDANWMAGAIVTAVLIALFFIIKSERNMRLLLFGIVWYVCFIIPTLFISDMKFDFYAYNHRMYLPLIGLLIAIIEIFAFNTKQYKPSVLWIALLTPSLVFLFTSFVYCGVFKNKYAFHEAAIKNSPHSIQALESLGNMYVNDKNCDNALRVYKQAVEVRPHIHGYYGLVGNTYLNCFGDVNNAIEWYSKAMQVDAETKAAANTAISLGNIYSMSLKDTALAKVWYMRAVRLDSSQFFPMSMLGNMYLQSRPDSAEYWFNLALKADSTSIAALNGIGIVFYNRGDFKNAAVYYEKALAYDNNNLELYKNIMYSYQALNDVEKTRAVAQEFQNKGGVLPESVYAFLK